MKKNVKLLGMVAMFSVTLASCTNDELKEVYQGEEISFTTRMTRATATTTDNLAAFKVYAAIPGYDMFINGEEAKKIGNAYYTDKSHFWPSGIASMKFWAYAPTDIDANITDMNQVFNEYTPDADITKQKDFIVAYEEVQRTTASGMSVTLNFHHALSQIEVKAHCPSTDKKVKLKGVWIVNVAPSGKLEFASDTETQVYTNHMHWMSSDTKNAIYGRSFSESQIGGGAETSTSLLASISNNSNLMLVPQTVEAYKFATKDDENDTSGAYILLLCRVESHHDGKKHGDGSESDPLIKEEEDKHIHQLFPYTAKYNKDEYGYTCVPVKFDWKPGKKYVYNLEFCGTTSGAGVYPPTMTAEDIKKFYPYHNTETDIIALPKGKKKGDPVLDEPIHFTVKVDEWSTESESDTPMN